MILTVAVFAFLFTPTLYITIVCITVIFTIITAFRARWRRDYNHSKLCWSAYQTSLYTGHVSHVRLQPKVHSFTYPIFFFLIDLSESWTLFQQSYSTLWPLSLFMQFNDCDHLKNGEGLLHGKEDPNSLGTSSSSSSLDNSLTARIQRLVAERTQGKYVMDTNTQPILLLTHLSYFGYCFNPVSFYYILKSKDDPTIEVIVAEVSNTPWLEMKCYVLHPDSMDMLTQEGSSFQRENPQTLHCIFPKIFHVSPFMDMNHMYDWTFTNQHLPTTTTTPIRSSHQTHQEQITVSTSMKQKSTGIHYFNAFLRLKRQWLHPTTVAIQLLILPFFCIIIQLWIHWEALRLMIKGIVFIPHPEGTTTRASRIIELLIKPFVFLYDKLNTNLKRDT